MNFLSVNYPKPILRHNLFRRLYSLYIFLYFSISFIPVNYSIFSGYI